MSKEWSGGPIFNQLVHKDICIHRAPSWTLACVFDLWCQRVGPEQSDCEQSLTNDMTGPIPFDSTLLSTPLPSHTLADNTPEDVIVHVFALTDCHIRHNIDQLLFFLLRPLT